MTTRTFRFRPGRALALPLLLLAGCAEPAGESRPTHTAQVYGRVTTSAGAPVAGARVVVTADRRGQCPADGAEYLDLPAETAFTGPSGEYRAEAYVFREVAAGCVRADASPPAGAGLARTSVSAGPVRFGAGPPADSIRIDIVLPPG